MTYHPPEFPVAPAPLSDADWRAALERIEHESVLLPRRTVAAEGPQRAEPRRDRRVRCTMRVPDDAGGHANFRVGTRNLSAGGMGVLHGAALDDGAAVVLALEADDGFGAIVPAAVAWCRRVGMVGYDGAVVYEIGLKFDRPLRLEAHLEAA